VGELDGIWKVERRSGLLPPMVGVHKHIAGARGETKVGALPGMPFDVHGLTLHYRKPFEGFVDELERDGSGYVGRATFRGREFARFALTRVPA
jgi:hypothetical protein